MMPPFRVLLLTILTASFAPAAFAQVDESPLPVKVEPAFPDLEWTGWAPVTERGRPYPLRPVIIENAGDGSNRLFVGIQQGTIHVFPNDQAAKKTKVFLDIARKVVYKDNENEEGFLGLAFHPKYEENGEFFVYYTTADGPPHTSVISRFRVSPDDPDRALPESEQEILRIPQPYWNHNGGTIVFGPDGYLYVALGDGGAANDPHGNGQDLGTLLGTILRIDVDRQDAGKNYAIPADNPFVDRQGVRGEIWAYGLRNVWRMSFDRRTGTLWAADVGQDLWEEIDLIVRGGNYGWNLREGMHPFGPKGVGPREDLIEPIWEYHHDVGKSITGGHVYRGQRVPALEGLYLYADYVTGKLWALRYDENAKKVAANHSIPADKHEVVTFGEDEAGDVYFAKVAPNGRGLFRFAPK
ncbi:MAG: PQQ-dependent sugar dehydrogenase [Planctomycetaceae bacterium]